MLVASFAPPPAVSSTVQSAAPETQDTSFQSFLDGLLTQGQADAALQNPALEQLDSQQLYSQAEAPDAKDHKAHLTQHHQQDKQVSDSAVQSGGAQDAAKQDAVKALAEKLRQSQDQIDVLLNPAQGLPAYMFIRQALVDFVKAYLQTQQPNAFIERVETFKTAQGQQGVRLVLWPEDLGRVEVLLRLSGKDVYLTFLGGAQFKQFALDQMGDLTQALQSQGYALASHDFGQGGGSQSRDPNREAWAQTAVSDSQGQDESPIALSTDFWAVPELNLKNTPYILQTI